FNCRFGDPECQPIMMRLKGDLIELMRQTANGELDQADLEWDERCCCCVVMASGGYPGDYEKGKTIKGIGTAEQEDKDIKVFHAGTARKDGQVVTAGGRVLGVCAMGNDLADAQAKANAACEKIEFEGGWFRSDIGSRVMD
ncbi:MAG: phosphoribosylglycinamide synthetase C domain-containing protein, partial [Phycisphaeraceae bacterium]|nr:phosphoribosylglycinamide synthetase C domain-containing protein [Phycisphaeraceae bacterium]